MNFPKMIPFCIFIFIILGLSCVRSNQEGVEIRNIPEIDNPSQLSYRFVQNGDLASEYVPIKLDSSGTLGIYNIQNNWRLPDTVSSIVFKWIGISRNNTIRQFNTFVPKIHNTYHADFDKDLIEEVAITYLHGDTLFYEVLDAFEGRLQKTPLTIGKDSNNSGYWDGEGFICNHFDVNGDGFSELFISCQTGYDIYPRKMMCADWKNGTVLWEYDIPGFISFKNCYIVHEPVSNDNYLIFGSGASCNGAKANDMDDCHSYLICMTVKGEFLWKHSTGEVFTHTAPIITDRDLNGIPEILTYVFPKISESSLTRHLILCDLEGQTLDSMVFAGTISRMTTLDYDSDGKNEIFLSFTDHSVLILDHDLRSKKILQYDSDLYFLDSYDFLKRGRDQLIAQSSRGRVILFDTDFEQLAVLEEEGVPSIFKSDSMQYNLTIAEDDGWDCFLLISSPWYNVFVRYPLVTFLSGFIPLAILASIIWMTLLKFRQKNRTISQQRDYLDVALKELRETQQRLIEYEKFKQAKDIAGGFAHEIRNALFPAKASLMKISSANQGQNIRGEEIAKFTNLADLAIAKAIDVTNQISDYVRLESMHRPEPVKISQVIREVIESNQLHIAEMDTKITTSGPEEICIESNRRQFFSVINNLLLNSLDALNGRKDNRISIDWGKSGSQVVLRFADNGQGMPDAIRITIFDAFRSYKEQKGIGLGLAIVKLIVEMYGGSIAVESTDGQGTAFNLTLKEFISRPSD